MKNLFFLLGILLINCSNDSLTKVHENDQSNSVDSILSVPKDTTKKVPVDSTFLSFMTDVQTVNKNIRVELKYATDDNFMKIKLYERMVHAYLQKDVAIRLGKCQDYLTSLDPTLHLLVYDAVRPLSIQKKMWKALDTIPIKQRVKFVSNPANKSVHNYGAAVDLTICDEAGQPLDMGAGYDDMRQIAYPSLEKTFLANGLLTQQQLKNRVLLRKVMSSQKFSGIPTEWWHFNACTREVAAKKYKVLEVEP